MFARLALEPYPGKLFTLSTLCADQRLSDGSQQPFDMLALPCSCGPWSIQFEPSEQ